MVKSEYYLRLADTLITLDFATALALFWPSILLVTIAISCLFSDAFKSYTVVSKT